MKAKHSSKAQRLNIITTLPQPIIETILCLLPIEEAARTSILSREWRYKWTTIPKLVFSESTVSRPSEEGPYICSHNWEVHLTFCRRKNDWSSRLFRAINQVMLLRKSPIHEFTLTTNAYNIGSELDQVLLHLSSNHLVKKLKLDLDDLVPYCLPLSFFSLHHLTDLDLEHCDFNHLPMINGFGSLTRLTLSFVRLSKETLLQLLSNCPSLKSWYWVMLEQDFHGDERPSIMELFKCLPMIEHLTIYGWIIPALVRASVPGELPTSLIHLKYCKITEVCFVEGFGLTFLAALTKCSPNLEKIDLEIGHDVDSYQDSDKDYDVDDEIESTVLEKYSDVWLEHLNELKIICFCNFEPELEFVKFILARSPNLKNVILLTSIGDESEELELLNILLNSPRASPMLTITVKDFFKSVRSRN